MSFGKAGSSWPGETQTTSAAATAVAKSVGEFQPPGIVEQSATTKPELAESSGGAGPSWSRANGNSAPATAAVKSAGGARPSRIVKYSVTSESKSELAENSESVHDRYLRAVVLFEQRQKDEGK